MKKQIIILLILMVSFIPVSFAENEVNLYLFYGMGCSHCARAIEFLDDLSGKYPELNIKKYEIYFNDENREIFMKFCSEVDKSVQGVPTIFIDDKTFVGFNNDIAEQIEKQLKRCLTEGCGDMAETCAAPTIKGDSDPINPLNSKSGYYNLIGWLFIIAAAAYVIFIIAKRIKKPTRKFHKREN